jgi:enoyl-[acyl-carrier protein] reductase II
MDRIKTRVTELFNIRYPIVQGGMIWVSGWKLASAVSNAGGLGLLGSAGRASRYSKEMKSKERWKSGKRQGG